MVLLLVLISTLFATSKSIFEEIEDRTMLTLMSKPVKKWEVLRRQVPRDRLRGRCWRSRSWGWCSAWALWWRIPEDYQLRGSTRSTTAS